MKRSLITGTIAVLAWASAAGSGFAQNYADYPYLAKPGNVNTIGSGDAALQPSRPGPYYFFPSYGYGPDNVYPNITGMPSQPVASPDRATQEDNRSHYYIISRPRSNTTAAIDVKVPAEAQLTFQGQQTRQRGSNRFFQSPPLKEGKTYAYKVQAAWMNDKGEKVQRTRTVQVHAGDRVRLDLLEP